jgi:hypothetical protein
VELKIAVEDDKGADERIARLTRELAEAINDEKASGRTEMRDYAIDLLRDEVETEVVATRETREAGGRGSAGMLNPFGLGIPLMLLGVLLTPLFGLVGLALAGIGALMCLVGVAIAMSRSRSRRQTDGG